MRFATKIRRLARSDRGAVAMIVAAGIAAFIGMVAIAVDLGVWYTARGQLQKAADAGLMVVPYPYAPGWVNSKAMRDGTKSIMHKDWVLAWNIGDDLHTPEQLKAALRTVGSSSVVKAA